MAAALNNLQAYPELELYSVQFKSVRKDILEQFEKISQMVVDRRDELLEKLSQMESEHKRRDIYFKETIEQLQATIKTLELQKFHNEISHSIDKFRKEIDMKINSIESDRPKLNKIDFQCDITKLSEHIQSFGGIKEEKIRDFQSIRNKNNIPISNFGHKGTEKGQFLSPRALKIDEINQHILIADSGNHCIHIFSLKADHSFITDLCNDMFVEPWGMCLHNGFLFVTDHKQHSIHKFNASTLAHIAQMGSLGAGAGELNKPTAIECDPSTSSLYVADYLNNRLCIYDMELVFLKSFLEKAIQGPICLQISTKHIYVLECRKTNLRRYTKSGIEDKQYFSMGTGEKMKYILFFSLDLEENIIATDYENNFTCVFNQEGQEIMSLGETIKDRASIFTNPAGVAVASNGTLYIASSQEEACVQIY